MTRTRRRLLAAALAAAACAPAVARAQDGEPTRTPSVYEDLQMFSQVLNQIRVNHPDSIDTHALFMAAVEGMIRAADPHSYVLPAARLSPDKQRQLREGDLVPVPIAFRYIDGAPIVVSVAPGTAAARLDILPGDELVAIDDEPLTATSEYELEVVLAGPERSNVMLDLERRRPDGSLVRLARTVARERPEDATAVPTAFLLRPGLGYVRVTTFASPEAANDLHDALERLEDEGMRRLLLDLRDNGGGLVDEAAQVAGEFLPKGAVVYTTTGRKEELVDTGRVSRSFWSDERRYPIVVLVDRGTASAAELVAGALQDHDRALIVGRPTFGKALMMQPFPLTDGSLAVLVVGQVHTPCGRTIQREYRSVSRYEYFRGRAREGGPTDPPSCETTGGRIVFGGDGIHPDVALPERATPTWLARVREADLPLRWVGGYVDARGDAFSDLEEFAARPVVPDAARRAFRAFAAEAGIEIPRTAEAETRLTGLLAPEIAGVKWGAPGFHRVSAAIDPDVAAAAELVERAETLLASGR